MERVKLKRKDNYMDNKPFYHKLYADMIRDMYPEKESDCRAYLQKENWTALDVIQINELLFRSQKSRKDLKEDQKHRAYDRQSILQILRYQAENKLNNTQLANKYGLSRNTVARWKKLFPKLTGITD